MLDGDGGQGGSKIQNVTVDDNSSAEVSLLSREADKVVTARKPQDRQVKESGGVSDTLKTASYATR